MHLRSTAPAALPRSVENSARTSSADSTSSNSASGLTWRSSASECVSDTIASRSAALSRLLLLLLRASCAAGSGMASPPLPPPPPPSSPRVAIGPARTSSGWAALPPAHARTTASVWAQWAISVASSCRSLVVTDDVSDPDDVDGPDAATSWHGSLVPSGKAGSWLEAGRSRVECRAPENRRRNFLTAEPGRPGGPGLAIQSQIAK